MDTFIEAIQLIVNEHREAEGVYILVKSISKDMKQLRSDVAEAKAKLQVIHKINKRKNKDIDNICQEADIWDD